MLLKQGTFKVKSFNSPQYKHTYCTSSLNLSSNMYWLGVLSRITLRLSKFELSTASRVVEREGARERRERERERERSRREDGG